MTKLTRAQAREIRTLQRMRDEEIDFTDIPLTVDWSKAVVGKFYRPIKTSLTIRLDADVLAWLKGQAPATKHESMRCCETRWKAPAPQPPHGQPTLPNVCNPGQSRPRKRPAMRVSARGA